MPFKIVQFENKILGCNSVTLECCHHVTYYVVGLFGYNFLLMLPWKDGNLRDGVMLAGGDCLPEHVNMDAMSRTDGSK